MVDEMFLLSVEFGFAKVIDKRLVAKNGAQSSERGTESTD
jgi:hypothetical protein